MLIKRLLGIIIFILCASGYGLSYDKLYQEQFSKRLDELTDNFLMLYEIKDLKNSKSFDIQTPTTEELDNFLKNEFGAFYPGFHPDIKHYVEFLSKRPQTHLKIWFTVVLQFDRENVSLKNNALAHLVVSRLEFPQYTTDDTWLIPHTISLIFGNKSDAFVDNRLQVFSNYSYRLEFLNALKNRGVDASHALASCVLGSTTITRIPNYSEKNYWQLYPDIASEHRDFYALMLASAYVLNQIKFNQNRFFEIEPKHTYLKAESDYAMHLEILAQYFKLPFREMKLMNRKFFRGAVPPKMHFNFPHKFAANFINKQEELALKSAYMIHDIRAPFCLVKYRSKASDDIQIIAANFATSVAEIQKINFLPSIQLNENQLLFIQTPQKDSIFFSAFDTLSQNQIQEQIKLRADSMSNWIEDCRPAKPANTSNATSQRTHVVKSGETLSHIARKYNVTVKQLKDWNKLKSDNIQIGQKLIIKK